MNRILCWFGSHTWLQLCVVGTGLRHFRRCIRCERTERL